MVCGNKRGVFFSSFILIYGFILISLLQQTVWADGLEMKKNEKPNVMPLSGNWKVRNEKGELKDYQIPHYVDGKHNEEYEHSKEELATEGLKGPTKEQIEKFKKDQLNKRDERADERESTPTRAEILSCSGWRLNKLPHIKKFLKGEAREFENLTVKYVGGDPRLLFYNADDKVINQINLIKMTPEEIKKTLRDNGFDKKAEK